MRFKYEQGHEPGEALDLGLPFDARRRGQRWRRRLFPLVMLGLLVLISCLALFQTNTAGASSLSSAGAAMGTTMPNPSSPVPLSQRGGRSAAQTAGGLTSQNKQLGGPLSSPGFTPYAEPGVGTSLQTVFQNTGVKNYTLAFMLANCSVTPCTCQAAWDGVSPLSQADPTIASDILSFTSQGGTMSISFGGAAGQELARICSDPGSLQAQYQAVIDKYHVTNLDFDIEGGEEGDATTYDRRNIALAALQQANPGLSIVFTLPVAPNGLEGSSLGLLRNAVSHGVGISRVNIMAMDYNTANIEMGQAAISAAKGLFGQLQQIFPGILDSQLWSMVGITVLIGHNDPDRDGSIETFTLTDASAVLAFAQEMQIGSLSFWVISRDNGGCAGSNVPSDTCSGIAQAPYAFTNIFKAFDGNGAPTLAERLCILNRPLNDPAQPGNCWWTVTQKGDCGIFPLPDPPWLTANPQVFECNIASDGGIFFCNVPIDVEMDKASVHCAKKQGGPLLICVYTIFTIGTCNPDCDNLPVTPTPNPLTGLPAAPLESGGAPVVCPVPTVTCTTPTTVANPAASDWLIGSSNGLLIATSPADTYGIALVQNLWLSVYGMAIALLAIPFALAGFQIIKSWSGPGRANGIELMTRLLLAVVAASLSYVVFKALIDFESGLVNTLFAKMPAPTIVNFMPSANWSCNTRQFFGSLFNLSVYNAQRTANAIDINTYLQNTQNAGATLVVNLSAYALTLLSVLLTLQLAVRLALLNVYIIVSPLTIVCSALPGRDAARITRAWLRGFGALLFVQVLQLLVFWAGVQFVPASWMSGTNWVNELFARLIPIAMLGITLSIPRLMHVSATNLLSAISSSIGGAMTGIVLIIRGV